MRTFKRRIVGGAIIVTVAGLGSLGLLQAVNHVRDAADRSH